VFADRAEIAAGEALAGKLRPGNAGSNTMCDHIEVLTATFTHNLDIDHDVRGFFRSTYTPQPPPTG